MRVRKRNTWHAKKYFSPASSGGRVDLQNVLDNVSNSQENAVLVLTIWKHLIQFSPKDLDLPLALSYLSFPFLSTLSLRLKTVSLS